MPEWQPTQWLGLSAWTLDSQVLRAVLVPDMGAKIVSLFDKRNGYEWLVGPIRPVKPAAYGARFVDQDMSGWDEMFPTINACQYPAPGACEGRYLPDHGEVWSLAWECEAASPAALAASVAGRALPYRLTRLARLTAPDTLQLDYTAENTGAEPLFYLWAAHPQFPANADTRIVLPEPVTQVYNVVEGATWGKPGTLYGWPEATTADGKPWHLDQVGPATLQDCRKFYLLPNQPVSGASLVNARAGCALHLTWPPDKVPYLGLWIDEGTYNTAPVAALEPSTGFYDSLTLAYTNHQVNYLEPGQKQTWSVALSLTPA
jgi:galactose mutarotase-like enzyme